MALDSIILKDVVYFLHDWEVDGRRYAEEPISLELDGELCLIFEGGQRIFISWRDPVSNNGDYWIDFAPTSFSIPEVLRACNMNEHPLWKSLVGQKISLLREQNHDTRIVVVTAEDGQKRFCCPYERGEWDRDTLYISQIIPT